MNLSKSVQIALTLLPLMGTRMKMERIVSLMTEHGLPHRKSVLTLRALNKAGILIVHRGAGGGYSLARKPDKITLAEIVKALDGDAEILDDSSTVRRAFRNLLNGKADQCTLADL